jgi:3-hydroxyethyl bacteriochlorophyllide a dehydrogenase
MSSYEDNVTESREGENAMQTTAVVFEAPGRLALRGLPLIPSSDAEVIVDVMVSGISTGTERLLWTGDMPTFPGMGYPLVPGYETVGRLTQNAKAYGLKNGDLVFVPGASCYGPIKGLFGGAAKTISITPQRLTKVPELLGEDATLLALAATAHHAAKLSRLPDLIIGHGVMGRLLARVTQALGGAPTVWESHAERRSGAMGYEVLSPAEDVRRDYNCIVDASGDTSILDRTMQHLAKRGEIILAGFYSEKLHFTFPPAFMREATIKIAAQWQPEDLTDILALVAEGKLSLSSLITHRVPASEAHAAYETAFTNPRCLKMLLDWRTV